MELTEAQKNLKRYLEFSVEARKRFGTLPEGFKYWCMEDYLLQHGIWYTPKPLPDRIKRGVPRYCFGNSVKRAGKHRLAYVEGIANSIIPIHHAWNADKDGNVIDSTWGILGSAYIGVPFETQEVNRLLNKGMTPLDNWEDGHPLFREAA